MFKLNLKIAWRNLLKYRSYAAVNILGLSVGLAGFIFILLFINREKSYDTWNPELNNVYQLREYSDYYSSDKKAHWRSEIDYRLAKIAESLPQFKMATRIELRTRKMGITVPGKPAFLQSGFRRADSLFFKVVPHDFKYGNEATAFLKPDAVVLKEDVATRYFGDINPVGKIINIAGGQWNKEESPYVVSGVVKAPKTPSSIDFEGIIFENSWFSDTDGGPSEIYIKTEPINDLGMVNRSLQIAYLPIKDQFLAKDESSLVKAKKEGNSPILQLTKLDEVHQAPIDKESWQKTLQPVILLSILLLLVSIINFINLATAQAASRAKEIGIKKVVGAYRKSLIFQLLTETFIQCLVSMFISLLLIEIALPTLNDYFALNLSLFGGTSFLTIIPQLLLLVVTVGLLTGFYPSIFLSAYKPNEVLKGNFSHGKHGSLVRRSLVTVQFVVSISFIIGILIVNYQLNYLKERDNGFTSIGLINIRSDLRYGDTYQKIKQIDGVNYVGFCSAVIGDNMANTQEFKYKNDKYNFFGIGLSIDGLQALDARLLAGRFFSSKVVQDTISNAIINESAAKAFNRNIIGETIIANDSVPVNIIGVIRDLQVEGFDKAVAPSIYYVQTDQYKGGVGGYHKQTTLIRFDPSKTKTVVAGIDKLFAEMNKYYPASYSFVEDDLTATLIEHERFEKMVALFSILSLTLSLFGLFALAAFITKQRTKEIAVRKVLGAAHADILVLLNKGYLLLVLIANLIAFPLTYILINKWLATFAYRINITALPFVLTFVASMIITIITVSLQARKAIKANPVKALKYE